MRIGFVPGLIRWKNEKNVGRGLQVSKFRSKIFLSPVNGGLNMTNGLSTIPDTEGDVTIPAHLYYNYPLYWMLPDSFLGDKVFFFLSLSLSLFSFLRV